MKQKKGQAEIIGLVIIVIMITLGMLFFIRFALDDTPEKKVFTRKGLAASTMNSIMNVEVYCGGENQYLSMPTLLKDCAKSHISGGQYNDYQCGFSINTCEYIKNEITFILDNTLSSWNKDYLLTINVIDNNDEELLFEISEGDCINTDRDSSRPFPIVSESGLIESNLFLCG
jgi:hypothetical protein